jgi:3-methyladenine DNA glycosylase AlkD
MVKYSDDSEDYIQKGIGWLLKTCSNYKPDIIFTYLMKNKHKFSRIVLRYASEKLPKQKRVEILKKI